MWITERGKDRIMVDPEICEEPSRREKIRLREQLSMVKEIFCEFLTERLLLKHNDVYKVSAKVFELEESELQDGYSKFVHSKSHHVKDSFPARFFPNY